jgi:hypothetical protein
MPNLRLVIKLWAKADSGKATGAERSEYRQLADSLGITPKGQADRRWRRPDPQAAGTVGTPASDPRVAFRHLRAVGDE